MHVDTGAVVVASSALPTGASTSALQTTGNSVLGSILLDLTNGTQITQVSNFPATQPVSGTVTANQGTPNTAANSWSVEITDGTNVLGTPTHPVRIDPVGTTAQPVTGTFFQATQPVSGTVTANAGTGNFTVVQSAGTNLHTVVDSSALPTGASTSANQVTALTRLAGSLVPTAYDEIDLTYTGDNVTLAQYKLLTVLVKTLTLTYTGDNLTSVVAS